MQSLLSNRRTIPSSAGGEQLVLSSVGPLPIAAGSHSRGHAWIARRARLDASKPPRPALQPPERNRARTLRARSPNNSTLTRARGPAWICAVAGRAARQEGVPRERHMAAVPGPGPGTIARTARVDWRMPADMYTEQHRVDSATLPPSSGSHGPGDDPDRRPGVVVVFSGGAAAARAIPLVDGSLELGRGESADGRVSRRHAVVAFDGQRWRVTDLGSQNGTFVDGAPATAHAATPLDRVIRIGDSLVIPCDDLRRLQRLGVRSIEDFVRGPATQAVLAEVEDAARSGSTLHIRGESGTGKEGIAQAFHRAGARAERPFVAVNCAAIPHAIAERLVFGAKRGAYSGADADAVGYVEQADGGTLFLDEIAELEPQVQAKLLRVLESHEVLPLGASRPRKVDFHLCSATNKDLRALVAAGALREDLYFRVGQPFVVLP